MKWTSSSPSPLPNMKVISGRKRRPKQQNNENKQNKMIEKSSKFLAAQVEDMLGIFVHLKSK